ncbi:MAG TPA: hypothetical protein VFW83_07975 [Bryobacteraceae bacterium]|nr:hypothetical protein [Bryobacteraceae bacterium]
MTRFSIVIIFAAAMAACNRNTPDLRPRLILQGENVGGEFWLQAPDIAVVKIVRASLEGPREPIFQGGPDDLQLAKFDANVENVIKGDLQPGTISFFFFAKTDQNPNYYLDPGKRYVVSLRREGNILRSWADPTQLKIEVHSGSHRQEDLPRGRGPATTIAYILLTPGADANIEDFEKHLNWPPNSYGGPKYVYERLKELETSPNRGLREAACIAAATMFWYRPECLEQVLGSPDTQVRLAAKKLIADSSLAQRLRKDPFFLAPQPWTEYALQTVEIFADDARPGIRKEACAVLRNAAPHRNVEACR